MTQTTHPEHDEELESLVRWITDKAQAFAEDKPVATFPVAEVRKRIAAHTAKAVEEAEIRLTAKMQSEIVSPAIDELDEILRTYSDIVIRLFDNTINGNFDGVTLPDGKSLRTALLAWRNTYAKAYAKKVAEEAFDRVVSRLPDPDNSVEEWRGHNLGLRQALLSIDEERHRLLSTLEEPHE